MIYLTDNDFNTQITAEILDELIDGDTTLLNAAELAAQSELESYLRHRYDMPAVWDKAGTNRHAIIVMYMVDLTLYHLHSRIALDKTPQLRMDRYDMAIDWLKRVSNGKISPNLPQTEEGGADEIRWGSNQKLSHGY